MHLSGAMSGTFEQREVVALLRSDSRSDKVTGVDMSVSTLMARAVAAWKDSEIVVGWIPVTTYIQHK